MSKKMKILWANFSCLLDTSSGASISVNQILKELKNIGHDIRILGATIFDSPKGVSLFGDNWKKILSIDSGKFIDINEGDLKHLLLKTKSTERSELTQSEINAWVMKYRNLIKYFKPDFIFFYGGGLGDLIPSEARAWNIPCGAYLVNASFEGRRWCRDVDTFITDTNATRDYYRNKLNIDPYPIGKFIGGDKINKNKNIPKNRLLYINPSMAKGAAIVVVLARLLERLGSSIIIEIVESRGDWEAVLALVNKTLGLTANHCPANIIITPNTSEMAEIYARTKLLIVPSLWWESGARVIAEAQLNGIPVIATLSGGNAEMVGEGGLLITLPKACHEKPYLTIPSEEGLLSVAKKIIEIFHNEEYYKKLSISALENSKLTSDIHKNISKLNLHLNNIIEKKQTWTKINYPNPSYNYFDIQRTYGEEIIYEPLLESEKGIFIDCGGYDGCSSVKFILDNPNFSSVTFEPNPELWHYYDNIPTTLIKKGVASQTEHRNFTVDEIDANGSSIVSEKIIDYNKKIKNENFKTIKIQCIDICEIIMKFEEYEKIILKLDIEGAEYEVLNRLINTKLISKINKLYIEWHWNKMGMAYSEHLKILNQVKKYCEIKEWDSLDFSVHNLDPDLINSRISLLKETLGDNINKYKSNTIINKFKEI